MIKLNKIYINSDKVDLENKMNALYMIKDKSGTNFVLYAVTEDTKKLKEFKKTRDMSLFYITVDIMDEDVFKEFTNICGLCLDYYDIKTSDNNCLGEISMLLTEKEYQILKRDKIFMSTMIYDSLVDFPAEFYTLNNKYKNVLNLLLFNILSVTRYPCIDKSELILNELNLVINSNDILFK